jgi:valyl-tRNA synthetase
LLQVLATSQRLLHPFMPFVTEALWQALPNEARDSDALILARWPAAVSASLDPESEARMDTLMSLIRGIRNTRAEHEVPVRKRVPATVATGSSNLWLTQHRAEICALASVDPQRLSVVAATEPPGRSATVVVGEVVCYLPLAGLVDLDAERERLSGKLADLQARIERSRGLLASDFAKKAPADIVQRERDKLSELCTEEANLEQRLLELA